MHRQTDRWTRVCHQAGSPYLPLGLLPREPVWGSVGAVPHTVRSILLQHWQQVLRGGVVLQPRLCRNGTHGGSRDPELPSLLLSSSLHQALCQVTVLSQAWGQAMSGSALSIQTRTGTEKARSAQRCGCGVRSSPQLPLGMKPGRRCQLCPTPDVSGCTVFTVSVKAPGPGLCSVYCNCLLPC